MTIVQLFPQGDGDHLVEGFSDVWTAGSFWIAHVAGAGSCPHQHWDKAQAGRCMRRMRRWLDFEEARRGDGLRVAPDGTEYVRLTRHGPGRRPSRRPW